MRKTFLLIFVLFLALMANATGPTITIDGDKSDWAEVPMLSQPGTWPMLKVLPAADAELGTNALAFMLEGTSDFVSDWSKYPGSYIDKDYDKTTNPAGSWVYPDMGIDYSGTTGGNKDSHWIDFVKAVSGHVIEIAMPQTFIDDLGEKFGIGMFYGTGGTQEWFCPDRDKSAHPEINEQKGFLYKTRSYTTLPGTLTIANAFAHPTMGECVDYVDFGMRDNGNDTARWAAFPIEFTQQAMYDVTTNVSSTNGWKFEFWLVNVETNAVVAHIAPPASDISESKTSYTFGPLNLLAVPAGKYMLKVKNRTAYSKVKLNSIDLAYAGGKLLNVSSESNTTLNATDAYTGGCTRADGLSFPSSGTSSAWIKWNIATSLSSFYNITLNVNAPNAHGLTIDIYDETETSKVASVTEGSYISTTGDITVTGKIFLGGGKKYVVKVSNAPSGSTAKILNLAFAPVAMPVTSLPNTLDPDDAATSEKAYAADDHLYFSSNPSSSNTLNQWGMWKVNVATEGTYLFTMNVSSENEQSYEMTISDESDNIIDLYNNKPGSGNKEIKRYVYLPVGNYFVNVQSTTSWSKGYVVSLVVSEPTGLVTLNETDESNTTITNNLNQVKNIQIIRTLKGGVYNTFCLPFAVSSSMAKDIFGKDVKIYTLKEATVDEFNILTLEFKSESDMYQGTPVFIQPARDVVNPVFEGVEFKTASVGTTTKTNANFAGTFVATTLPANSDILFLESGTNNLFYPTAETPIKGMRGWLVIHDTPTPSYAIKHAHIIVQGTGETTDVEIIGDEFHVLNSTPSNAHKIFENGHVIIIHDGIRYNVCGQRVE